MKRFSISLLAVTLLAGFVPVSAATSRPLIFGGSGCEELQVILPTPETRARPFVPDVFELDATGGVVQVFVGFVSCARLELKGKDGPGMVSEVGIAIRPPRGESGSHVYALWQLSDRVDMRKALSKLGLAGGVADISFVWNELAGGTMSADASVDWKDAVYSVQSAGTAPLRPVGVSRSTWWHAGRKGVMRIDYLLSELAIGTTGGTVTVEGGSPLADLLGGGSQVAAVPTYRFHFRASARRVTGISV